MLLKFHSTPNVSAHVLFTHQANVTFAMSVYTETQINVVSTIVTKVTKHGR